MTADSPSPDIRGVERFHAYFDGLLTALWYDRKVMAEYFPSPFAKQRQLPQESSMSTLAKILYIASVLRARPRVIDRYIDYFGERAS
jgi:hypothetical protein